MPRKYGFSGCMPAIVSSVVGVGNEAVVDADTEVEHVSGLNRFERFGCRVDDVGGEQLRSREFGDILGHARTLAH